MVEPGEGAGREHRIAGWLFMGLYALAMIGAWMTILTPLIVTLPLRIHRISPGNEGGALSLVLGVGAVVAMATSVLTGRLSDRTVSPWGRRRPWMIGGAVGGVVGIAVVATAPSVGLLLVGWCLTQLSINAALAGLTAILPDQVPERQRGWISGVLGMSLPVGQVLGTFLAQALSPNLPAMFMAPALAALALIGVFACFLPDRASSAADRPREPFLRWIAAFWIDPRRAPDFAWAWASRFLFMLGLAFLLNYQAFFLIHHIRAPEADVPRIIFLSALLSSGLVCVASLLGGKLSDLLRRRKVFVAVAAAAYAVSLWGIAASGSVESYLIAFALAGLGQGLYLGVDMALVTDVLPDRETDAAKNLGVFNMASALPQTIAPAIAPAILFLGRGDYSVLFTAAGAFAAAGALAVLPISKVR